jgi:hypothetical protein
LPVRLLALALLALAACTFLTRFPNEGRPCDESADGGEQCLQGYHCEEGACVPGEFDAGAP